MNIIAFLMWNACIGGHIDIVNLMILNGADSWDFGLNAACKHGHIELIKMMMWNGADNWEIASN